MGWIKIGKGIKWIYARNTMDNLPEMWQTNKGKNKRNNGNERFSFVL